jgi:hypothetical protein
MPQTGVWGFLTLLMLIAVAYIVITDMFGVRTSLVNSLGLPGTSKPITLLCTGGEGAACCNRVQHEYTSNMAITIDRPNGRVYVFVEDRSAIGQILEDEEGHLLFGKKPTEKCEDDACRIADGEINRLTGIANIKIIDQNSNSQVEWHNIECRRRWRKF